MITTDIEYRCLNCGATITVPEGIEVLACFCGEPLPRSQTRTEDWE